VTIRRFKRLEAIEVPFDNVTLLIGANNSGKSSILQAIHFAVSIAQTARLVGEGIAWANDSFQVSYNPSFLLYSPVSDVHSLATGGLLQEPRESQIEIEFLDEDGERCKVGLRRGRNRNVAVVITGRTIGERLMDISKPFTVYAPGLAGIPKEERYMSPGVVRRIVARGDANLTLRNVYRMLNSQPDKWDEFMNDMRSLFEGINIDVGFDEDTDENINVSFKFPNGPWLPVDAAGTSVLQASQILAYIALFEPQILILDEPDSHLHPDNQRALCELVFKLAPKRNFQAIISTHSRHVLNAMKGRGSMLWLSKGNKVESTDINTTEILLELGALDTVDYFADGQTRCVVATEDSITTPLKVLLQSNSFVEEDTEIRSYAGCSKADAAIVLGSFLADKAPHVKLVVHRDRDYISDDAAKTFEDRLAKAGIASLLPALNDIESCFLTFTN